MRLTETDAESEADPVWPPRGRRIAFSSLYPSKGTGGEPEGRFASDLVIVEASGAQLLRVTDAHRPSWSPDGRHVVVERRLNWEGVARSIWVVGLDDQRRRIVSAG